MRRDSTPLSVKHIQLGVGINKKEHPDGTPFKGYEYCKANVIKHGKQKLG